MTVPISKLVSSTASYNIHGRMLGFLAENSPLTRRPAKCRVRASSKLAVTNSNNSGMVSKLTVLQMMTTLGTSTFAINLWTRN